MNNILNLLEIITKNPIGFLIKKKQIFERNHYQANKFNTLRKKLANSSITNYVYIIGNYSVIKY